MKETQKSAFIVSHNMHEFVEGKGMTKRHEYPLLVISKVDEMIKFLSRYTDFQEWTNNDQLTMREELKTACYLVKITKMDLLRKEVLNQDYGNLFEHYLKEYPEHFIHVHRVPHGIYKKTLNVDFIP